MRFADVVDTSDAVAAASGRLEKIRHLSGLLARTPPDEIAIVVSFLSGEPRQGRMGIGYAQVMPLRDVTPAGESTLDVRDVDETFTKLAATSGRGSANTRADLLRQLAARAVRRELDFLVRLLFGELRQGALEGVLVDAVANASNVPSARIRRAAMLAGDLAAVATAALTDGGASLDRFVLQIFTPVQPMLADTAADLHDALTNLKNASLEYKLDGARIQVHKSGDDVRVFSRNLRDVTPAVPDVVEIVRALPAREIVLDGEAIVMRPDGTPQPFQVTMRRFGRRLDVDRLRAELPVTPFFFDALYVDGDPLIDDTLTRRIAVLEREVPDVNRVPRLVTANADEAAAFVERALAIGHEGVMAKALDADYAAGRRGSAWLKVKQARTLDLVVLAAEWGSGRRTGTLSNLHLGARDDERGGFVMLGKTFKGLTDELLAWQTERFLEIAIARDARTVHVRPEMVVEIAFDGIQASSQYAGGLALRFARVKRYRSDKRADQADTFAMVQSLYTRLNGLPPPVR